MKRTVAFQSRLPVARSLVRSSIQSARPSIAIRLANPLSHRAFTSSVLRKNRPTSHRQQPIDSQRIDNMAQTTKSSAPWELVVARKQDEQKSRIPKEWLLNSLPPSSQLDVRNIPATCGILNDKELKITTNYDATSLLEAIRGRKYTSYEVTLAFCKRAAIAQQLTNCLTEIFFDRALVRAKELDEYMETHGRAMGPLHGLPISVKDSFDVKGLDSSIGIAALAFKPATANALLVDILLKAGAVLYVKTNIPQTLMALDSINNCFGRVLNPANRLLTAGGSSGGEGALIALRGSLLGVGTDVGGSIRIPAMCNGLYGLKPSVGRLPYSGQVSAMRKGGGGLGLKSSAGPLATSLRDCELVLKVVGDAQPWESEADVVPGFYDSAGSCGGQWEKPVFGILRTDNISAPLPPVAAVLEETATALRDAGLDCHEIDPTAFSRCQGLANKFFSASGDNEMLDLLESTGEPLIPWLASRISRRPAKDVKFLEDRQVDREELVKEMLKIFRTKDGRRIDALICPVAPHPVPEVDRWNATGYTASFVLLDWPAGVLPVRSVGQKDIELELQGEAKGSWDKRNRELWDPKTMDRKKYLGSPLSIQVVAPRLQERRLVEGMKIIEKVLADEATKAEGKSAKL